MPGKRGTALYNALQEPEEEAWCALRFYIFNQSKSSAVHPDRILPGKDKHSFTSAAALG
jgi:hypothetical protein